MEGRPNPPLLMPKKEGEGLTCPVGLKNTRGESNTSALASKTEGELPPPAASKMDGALMLALRMEAGSHRKGEGRGVTLPLVVSKMVGRGCGISLVSKTEGRTYALHPQSSLRR